MNHPPPQPPPGVTFAPIAARPGALAALRALNAACLPVRLSDGLYAQCLAAGDLTHGGARHGRGAGLKTLPALRRPTPGTARPPRSPRPTTHPCVQRLWGRTWWARCACG